MAPQERNSWFIYREGIDTRMLTLGTLVFDYANPKDLQPYRHPPLREDEQESWIVSDERRDVCLAYDANQSHSIGGGLINLAELDLSRSTVAWTAVIGEIGGSEELTDPQAFLNDVVLKAYLARLWLSSRLAIARKLYLLRKLTLQAPRIWLLTKLYKIKDARNLTIQGKTTAQSAKGTVPLPDPTGVAQLLSLNAGLKLETKSGHVIQLGSQILGERVWAAQFQRLDVHYTAVDATSTALPNQVPLLNIFSVQHYRGEDQVGELSVSEESAGSEQPLTEEEVKCFDADFWEAFGKEVGKVEADMDEEEDL